MVCLLSDVDDLILGSGKEGVKDEVSLQFNEYVSTKCTGRVRIRADSLPLSSMRTSSLFT